jgi:hypothetical protein
MDQIDIIYSNAVDKPTAIVKHKLHQLLGESLRKPSDFFREVGKSEATTETGEMFDFVTKLNDAVRDWRSNNTSNNFV